MKYLWITPVEVLPFVVFFKVWGFLIERVLRRIRKRFIEVFAAWEHLRVWLGGRWRATMLITRGFEFVLIVVLITVQSVVTILTLAWDNAAYYCNFCGTRVLHPTARYRIKVNVVDESGSTTFVLFDRLASMLLNKDCVGIINSSTEVDNNSSCPAIISALVDKEFLFKVDVNDRTPKQFEKTYIVKKITNDNSIIEKFKYMNSIPSVSSTKVSVHAVSDALDPKPFVSEHKDSSKTELDGSDVNDDVELDGSAVNDDVEPLSLLTPLESVGNSKGKAAMDDLVYLKTTVSSATRVASDVGEILHEKINPRPLKHIKIEKE
ncbi:hypothetical protein OROGR_012019 [Orobanche gracilis]